MPAPNTPECAPVPDWYHPGGPRICAAAFVKCPQPEPHQFPSGCPLAIARTIISTSSRVLTLPNHLCHAVIQGSIIRSQARDNQWSTGFINREYYPLHRLCPAITDPAERRSLFRIVRLSRKIKAKFAVGAVSNIGSICFPRSLPAAVDLDLRGGTVPSERLSIHFLSGMPFAPHPPKDQAAMMLAIQRIPACQA